MLRSRSLLRSLALLATALLLSGCDNVGSLWDPVVDPPPGGGGNTTTSQIQVPPSGGDIRDGRPIVRQAYPRGGGWPLVVPIVVEFSESMNEASVRPTTTGGTDGRVILRVQGTTQPLPALYDFVANGRLLILRPTPALSNQGAPTYEVVMLPGVRDTDGVRTNNSGEDVLAVFTVDEADNEQDGRILALFPRDNQRDIQRSTDVIAVFTKPANANTISSATFKLDTPGPTPVGGDLRLPLTLLGVDDPRIVRFRPISPPLLASTQHDLTVTAGITFGTTGVLDFSGRTPFSKFTTAAVPAPTGVTVRDPTPGFPDKINRANLQTLKLDVALPADALAGDRVVARIYGGDRSTQATGDLVYIERSFVLTAGGVQTVPIDFAGTLGTVDRPKFDDGSASLVAQLRRGSIHSGIVRGSAGTRVDTTVPTLVSVGPPASGNDVLTDQEDLALFGTASEQLGAATLTVGAETADLFAAASDGRFLMEPVTLGRQIGPLAYTLDITDLAGNPAALPITGNIVQRGLITGLPGPTLDVVVYDDATLRAVAGAEVLVEPGEPVVPATGFLRGTTDTDGKVQFTGLAGGPNTVTVVAAGYHLTTLYNAGVAFASLPLRPIANGTATLRGTIEQVPPVPDTTMLVGSTAFDDPSLLAVGNAPDVIPPTAIRPNRPQVLTTIGGDFDPPQLTFSTHGCQVCGSNLLTPTPPNTPAPAAGELTVAMQAPFAVPSLVGSLGPNQTEDFALATGLGALDGDPLVRFTMSLRGFGAQSLTGTGVATLNSGSEYAINGSYSLALLQGLAAFQSAQWMATEARDTGGNMTRHRVLILQPNIFNEVDPQAIPVVTELAAGPAPQVGVDDVLSPTLVAAGLCTLEVRAQDAATPASRQWLVLVQDVDAVGGADAIQFPDLASVGLTGLLPGTWSVRATARLFVAIPPRYNYVADDFVLAEQQRHEINMSRSAAATITAQ